MFIWDPKGVLDLYEKPVDGVGNGAVLWSSPEHKWTTDWSAFTGMTSQIRCTARLSRREWIKGGLGGAAVIAGRGIFTAAPQSATANPAQGGGDGDFILSQKASACPRTDLPTTGARNGPNAGFL